MNTLQPQSVKISKQPKDASSRLRKFICGCGSGYLSYSALYRHVRQKHGGVMPPGTTVPKPDVSDDIVAGRPNKPKKKLDNINETSLEIERVRDELTQLLAEKLEMASEFGFKVPLEAIISKVKEVNIGKDDKWLQDFKEESDIFFEENKKKEEQLLNLDLIQDFFSLDRTKPIKILVWFAMWLAKIDVKIELVPDICLIFTRIWKVVDENKFEIQDLDNKLVWRKVIKECEDITPNLTVFSKDISLIGEFVQKCCYLIGKPLEKKEFA